MNTITDSTINPHNENHEFTLNSPEEWRLSVKVSVDKFGWGHATVLIDGKFAVYEWASYVCDIGKEWDDSNVKYMADETMQRFAARLQNVLQGPVE